MKENAVKRFAFSILPWLFIVMLPGLLQARQNNIAVTIERVKGDQIQPKIISAGSAGGARIFWIDGRDGNKSIYMQNLAADGTPAIQGGTLVVNRSSAIVSYAVAIAPDDGVFLAWQEATTSRLNDVFVFRLNADGTTWPAPLQLGVNTRHQGNPHLRIDGSNGAYVVWEDRPPLSIPSVQNKAIIAQHFDRGGKALWKAGGVDVVSQKTDQNLGDVLAVKEALVVAWENTPDQKAYMLALQAKDGSGLTDAGFIPSTTSARMARPKLALADEKNDPKNTDVFVVWEENSATRKIDLHAQKIDLTGDKKWSGDGKSVNTQAGDQFNHVILDDGKENLFVVWQDSRKAKLKIYAQKLNSSGSKRFRSSGLEVTAGDGDGNQANPKIAPNGDRGIYCAWEDDRNGIKDIYAQEIKSSGSLGWKTNGESNVPVAVHTGVQANISVYMHPDKRFAVAWEDGRAEDVDVYAQNISENGTLDNVSPAIISTPDTTASTGEQYTYQVLAIDYDRDLPFVFNLLQAPDWLQIDASTGLVSGVPQASNDADQLQAKIEIQVADNRGAIAAQAFVLTITSSNHAPQITSRPATSANEDETYLYQIRFDDPDPNDTHTFIGEQLPAWLNLAGDTGLMSGTPTNDDVGETQVAVRVQDQDGASDRQEFTLTVNNTNDPPFFTSKPDTIAFTDSLYQY
ncbi:MAG: putative Ig domain-containing protein, partial [bacterium]